MIDLQVLTTAVAIILFGLCLWLWTCLLALRAAQEQYRNALGGVTHVLEANTQLLTLLDQATAWLKDAEENLDDWSGYVPYYFREKYQHEQVLKTLDTQTELLSLPPTEAYKALIALQASKGTTHSSNPP